MPFIATDRFLAVAAIAVASCCAQAKDLPPRVLQDPVLGLRLNAAKPELDPLPDDARAKCPQFADDERWTGKQWVFARADDAGATHYVIGGYFKRRNPAPGERPYELDEVGGVITIIGNKCLAVGPAREVFDVGVTDETPLPILQRLASDLAVRLARAAGGPDRLRVELRNQRIDADRLTPELYDAFKAYLTPAPAQARR